jgi:hypothetical protein
MIVQAQPAAILHDSFVVALLTGRANWPELAFPTVQVIDRFDTVVAGGQMTNLRVGDDGTAQADPVWLENYTPGGPLMAVVVRSRDFAPLLTIELAPSDIVPAGPFWLEWDARGVFRP